MLGYMQVQHVRGLRREELRQIQEGRKTGYLSSSLPVFAGVPPSLDPLHAATVYNLRFDSIMRNLYAV